MLVKYCAATFMLKEICMLKEFAFLKTGKPLT